MAATSAYPRYDGAAAHSWIAMAIAMLALAVGCGYTLAMGEMVGLYVSLSLIGAMAVLFDFRAGAVLLLMMLPVSASALFPHGMLRIPGLNPLNLVLLATMASFLVHGGLRRALLVVPQPLLWLFVAPIIVGGLMGMDEVSGIPSFFYETGAIAFYTPVQYLVTSMIKPLVTVAIAVMIGAAAAASTKPERFVIAIAVSAWALALIQIGFVLSQGAPIAALASAQARGFYEPLGMHANQLGRLHLFAFTLLAFVWAEAKRPGLRLFVAITLGLLGLAMLLTFSRAAIGAAGIVAAIFVIWKFNMKSLGFLLVAFALLALFGADLIYSRMTRGFDEDANAVSAGRIDGIWLPLLPELFKSPLWGNGLNSILWSFPMVTESMSAVGHPHNAYLEALLDLGIIGFVLLGAYYLHVWKGFRALAGNARLAPELRGLFQGAIVALIAFFLTGTVGSSLRPEAESAYLWFAIGLMYGLRGRKQAG